jgi:hypothetical protein
MKVTLTFDYDEITDVTAHRRAVSATDAFLVIHVLLEHARDTENEELSELIYSLLDRYDVNMSYLD